MKKTVIGLFAVLLFASITGCKNNLGGTGGSYVGTKAPSEAKAVGDIVFNDGSATPYTRNLELTDAQKRAAIAIIFYRGRNLNDGGDTTTVRTLGVGLTRSDAIYWCKRNSEDDTANAWNKDITSIRCIESGSEGNYTFTGDLNGKDNFDQMKTFLTAQGLDDTGTAANYPAFYFARNYKDALIGSETESRIIPGSEFENGWYLPSIAELFWIDKLDGAELTNGEFVMVNNVCRACGANGIFYFVEDYWSSSQSEDDPQCVKILNYSGSRVGDYYKCSNPVNSHDTHALAIREF